MAQCTHMGNFHVLKYGRHNLCAFASSLALKRALVVVPGLKDKVFSLPYLVGLRQMCDESNIALVTFQMRSLPHYGIHTIEEDVNDIASLFSCLEGIYEKVILLGHSTGCQGVLLYLNREEKSVSSAIERCILQAPVSDRELEEFINSDLVQQLEIARSSPEDAILPFRHNGTEYITGRRFIDLVSPHGKEDLFSLDIDTSAFNPKGVPIYSLISEKDEYMIVDSKKLAAHLQRIPGMVAVYTLANQTHAIEQNQEEFFATVRKIVCGEDVN